MRMKQNEKTVKDDGQPHNTIFNMVQQDCLHPRAKTIKNITKNGEQRDYKTHNGKYPKSKGKTPRKNQKLSTQICSCFSQPSS